MTPRQRDLARHALGLPNRNRQSYRNRFLAGGECADWRAMVTAGLAECAEPDADGRTWYWLTRAGAHLALNRGESLCREDFPPRWVVRIRGLDEAPMIEAQTRSAARYAAFKAAREAGCFQGRGGFAAFLTDASVYRAAPIAIRDEGSHG